MIPEAFQIKDNIHYDKKVYFHIPAIFNKEYLKENRNVYALIKQLSRENVELVVYGCPMSCTWNGGRLIFEPVYRIETLYEMFFYYLNALGIGIQLTFTNYLIEPNDVYDRIGNAILKLVSENFADRIQVMVASDILEDYIRKTYPNVQIVRSIVKLTPPTKEDFEKYSMVVLPKWQNYDYNFIAQFEDYYNKLEMLVDEPCITNCPRKKTHYLAYNKSQMMIPHNDPTYCDKNTDGQFFNELMILPEQLKIYTDMGITHFKLRGRENNQEMIHSVSEYIIRADQKNNFISEAFKLLASRMIKMDQF